MQSNVRCHECVAAPVRVLQWWILRLWPAGMWRLVVQQTVTTLPEKPVGSNFIILKLEAADSSETFVPTYQTTWHHIPVNWLLGSDFPCNTSCRRVTHKYFWNGVHLYQYFRISSTFQFWVFVCEWSAVSPRLKGVKWHWSVGTQMHEYVTFS
jgi:hypothetical protein